MTVLFDKNSKKLITSRDGRDFCRHGHTITFMRTLHWQSHDLTRPLKQVGPADRDKAFSRKRLRVVFKAGRYTFATLCLRITVKHTAEIRYRVDTLAFLFSFGERWPCSPTCMSSFQALVGCFRQMLLHHNSLRGVQEKKKVRMQGGFVLALFPLIATCIPIILHFYFFSQRQYTVPDEPGLFDGHVWPMYLKHRKLMEDSGLNIRKFLRFLHFIDV